MTKVLQRLVCLRCAPQAAVALCEVCGDPICPCCGLALPPAIPRAREGARMIDLCPSCHRLHMERHALLAGNELPTGAPRALFWALVTMSLVPWSLLGLSAARTVMVMVSVTALLTLNSARSTLIGIERGERSETAAATARTVSMLVVAAIGMATLDLWLIWWLGL